MKASASGKLKGLIADSTLNKYVCSALWTSAEAHSHYCIVRMHLQQMVAFLQGDRKFPASALTQPTAENADCCIYYESTLRNFSIFVTSPMQKQQLTEYCIDRHFLGFIIDSKS